MEVEILDGDESTYRQNMPKKERRDKTVAGQVDVWRKQIDCKEELMSSGESKIVCPACNKKFVYQQEYVGKKCRCACGKMFRMPASPMDAVELLPDVTIHLPKEMSNSPVDDDFNETDAGGPIAEEKGSATRLEPQGGGQYELSDPSVRIDTPPPANKTKYDPNKAAQTSSSPAKVEKAKKPAEGKCPGCGQPLKPNAVICVNCGTDLRTGKPIQTAGESNKEKPAKKEKSSATPSTNKQKIKEQEELELQRKFKMKEIYIPVALLAAGILCMTVTRLFLMSSSATEGALYLIIGIVIELVLRVPLLLVAIVVTSKLMQASFGPLLTALLKLTAIAFFTAGVGETIDYGVNSVTSGLGSVFITPILHLGIFWGLCAWIFDLEALEVQIIWVLSVLLPWFAMPIVVSGLLAMFI